MKTLNNIKTNSSATLIAILWLSFLFLGACQPEQKEEKIQKKIVLNYPDGKVKVNSFTYNDDSTVHTFFTSFYSNGQIDENYILENDLKAGPYHSFFYDGQMKEYCFYKNGLEDGEYITYYPNRHYFSRISWKDGVLDGKSTYFYPNGKILQSGQFKDGLKFGEWIDYDIEGNIYSKQINHKGELVR